MKYDNQCFSRHGGITCATGNVVLSGPGDGDAGETYIGDTYTCVCISGGNWRKRCIRGRAVMQRSKRCVCNVQSSAVSALTRGNSWESSGMIDPRGVHVGMSGANGDIINVIILLTEYYSLVTF